MSENENISKPTSKRVNAGKDSGEPSTKKLCLEKAKLRANTNRPNEENNINKYENNTEDHSTGSADEIINMNEDESSSVVPLHGFDIDDKLEEKLKKHGLNRRNAKTIIHELLNDEHVLGLLKANLDKTNPQTFPEGKVLRSKQKKASSETQKFTDLPFPDDEDDDDGEYNPENDDEFKPNKVDDLDDTFDTEISQDTQVTNTSFVADENAASSNDSFMTKLKKCDSEIEAIQAQSEREIIALRTRSKHSLLDTAIVEIETAFKPPDVEEDMYKPSGDDDWHQWLAELMLDDDILTKPEVVDVADDVDEDPDYNFLQSDTEDANDVEDYINGQMTHIPKKEVQELLQERHAPKVTFQGELQPARSKNRVAKSKAILLKDAPPPLDCGSVTVKEQISVRRKRPTHVEETPPQELSARVEQVDVGELVKPDPPTVKKKTPGTSQLELKFTSEQLQMLKIQLQMHVQLLIQVNLLSRNSSTLSPVVHDTHALLRELQQLEEHDRNTFNVTSSYFNVPHISQALDIAQLNISKSEQITRLTKSARGRGYLPIQRNIGVLMATSPVFVFAPLLPPVSPPVKPEEHHSRLTFTASEDKLLVLGVAQMQGHALPWHTLVYQYLMPCKQPDQLRSRFSNSTVRSDSQNPIRIYKRTKQLPSPPKLFPPIVGPGTNVEVFLYLKHNSLPDWLVGLQTEMEVLSRPKIPSVLKRISATVFQSSETPKTATTKSFETATHVSALIAVVNPMKTTSAATPTVISELDSPDPAPIAPASETCPTSSSDPVPTKKSKLTTKTVKSKTKRRKTDTPSMKQKSKNAKEKSENSSSRDLKIAQLDQIQVIIKKVSDDVIEANGALSVHQTNIESCKESGLNQILPVSIESDQSADLVSINDVAPRNVTPLNKTLSPQKEEKITSKEEPTSKSLDLNKEDLNPAVEDEEEVEDEAVTTEDDYDEETDFHLNEGADEMSEEEEVTSSKKRVEKKKKKDLKVKWKIQKRANKKQLGGRLHRLHPGLAGKRKSKASEDDLSRNLRESAERVKLLEEETIVQLDPLRGEKEHLFAQGYLKRMENVLSHKPDVFVKILETLSEFRADRSQPPTALFNKLKQLLEPWPELLQGFAPFLMPEQAHKCGLLPEQQVYARARKFLRQLEIRFQGNTQQLTRILTTFKTIAETGIYKEKEVKNTILSLLKCEPYLQEEFLMFFEDERPPESRLHGDYEEITWTDELMKETFNSDFEQIHIPAMEHYHHEHAGNNNEGDTIRSPARSSINKSPKDGTKKHEPKEPNSPSPPPVSSWDDLQDLPATDTEDDGADNSSHKEVAPPCLPDPALISEDALSCSPFKRLNPPPSNKPSTPTSTAYLVEAEISVPSHTQSSASSSVGSHLPDTPTVSKSSVEEENTASKSWNFDDDKILLNSCKEYGPSDDAFLKVSTSLNRTEEDVRNRFKYLLKLLAGKDSTDTDTTSCCTDSETEVNVE